MLDIFVATTENKEQQPSLKRLDEMIYGILDSFGFSIGEIKRLYVEYSRQGLIQGIYDMVRYLLRTREDGCLDKGILHDIYLRLLDINRLNHIGAELRYEVYRSSFEKKVFEERKNMLIDTDSM